MSGDSFGNAVALSGNGTVALVGSPLHADDQYLPGRVYVFARSGGTWHRDGELRTAVRLPTNKVILPTPTFATFGFSLALDRTGATLLVGAGPGLGSAGYVYMHGG